METIFSTIPIGIAAFVATNIDDLFLITVFFSNPHYRNAPIVAGEFIGILALSAISLMGYLASFAAPLPWIGILGLLPILIGLNNLKESKPKNESQPNLSKTKSSTFAIAMSVALMTVANGGDNIGVYTPLFASSPWPQIVALVLVFLAMMGIWCLFGYFLINNKITGKHIQKIGHKIFPFVLIALGFYVFAKCGTFQLISGKQ
jgi:cadmium resistance protein CadD (predicted permease)